MMYDPTTCPYCKADLTGEPIPEETRPYLGGRTHWTTAITVVSPDQDRTVAYECPECSGCWHADTGQKLSFADAYGLWWRTWHGDQMPISQMGVIHAFNVRRFRNRHKTFTPDTPLDPYTRAFTERIDNHWLPEAVIEKLANITRWWHDRKRRRSWYQTPWWRPW